MAQAEELHQIGDAAAAAGTTPRALRHYETLGLLSPSKVGPRGVRLYTAFDVKLARDIIQLGTIGFSLEEIHDIMALKRVVFSPEGKKRSFRKGDVPVASKAMARLRERTRSIRQTIKQQEALLKRLEAFLEHCGAEE